MHCERVNELLPWYLNRSLDAAERQEVESHLAACESCRRELAETGQAFLLFSQHLPSDVLVDHVLGRPNPKLAPATVRKHLEDCPECAAEAALVGESGEALAGAEREAPAMPVLVSAAKVSGYWRPLALAASIAFLVAVGGWLRAWSPDGGSPQLNVPVVDLFPAEAVQRGEERAAEAVQIPAGVRSATLILNSRLATGEEAVSLEIVDRRGEVLWSLTGPRRGAAGELTVALPVDRLSRGVYSLHLYGRRDGERVRLETYLIEVG